MDAKGAINEVLVYPVLFG